jgi:hypothetical protein
MVFFPPIIPRAPSQGARELGHKVAQLIREELTSNPQLSTVDVEAALRVGLEDLRADIGGLSRVALVMLTALAVLLAGGVFAFVLSQ